VWDGVGLAFPESSSRAGLAAETELRVDPGDYTVALSLDLAPADAAMGSRPGVIHIAASGRALGEPIALDTVAAATRAGSALPWTAIVHHVSGPFRLEARLETAPSETRPPPGRLWLSDLRVLRRQAQP
jgi:hypothetical protein